MADDIIHQNNPERIGVRSIREDLLWVYDYMEALAEGARSRDGTKTGLSVLDLFTGGVKPGHLYVIAARPGQGRTSLALGIALYVAGALNRTAVFFTPGLMRKEIMQRIISAQANVDSMRVSAGSLTEDEWIKIALVTEALFEAPLFIDNNPNLTSEYVLTESRAVDGIEAGLIVVNGLELMEAARRRSSRGEELTDIALELKHTARELNAPLIITCGLSRDTLKRIDRRPQLWDLPGDGSLAEIVDGVFYLYRHSDQLVSSSLEGPTSPAIMVEQAELIVAKNPDGPSGMVHIGFAAAFRKFIDWPETTEEERVGF